MAGDSKTEKATPKKRRDERKKGNVLMSKDIIAVATLFGSFLLLRVLFPGIVSQIYEFFRYCIAWAANPPANAQENLTELTVQSIALFFKTAGPLLGITVLTATVATFAQTKFLVAGDSLKPKFSRINPLEGFKKLFSIRSLVEAVKGVIKISVLIYIIFDCISSIIGSFYKYFYTDISATCAHLFGQTFSMALKIGAAFAFLAALDFIYQWWDYERQLKMSKHDIKEEYKQTEGNPQIKGKIKEIQRKMSQARMMQQVPQADVVIRNPTHFAVALRYKSGRDDAPMVLAKGQDQLAQRIVSVAQQHGIAIVENVPLARSLYAEAEVNQQIPQELYGAVAEVLVYLYRLDRESKKPNEFE